MQAWDYFLEALDSDIADVQGGTTQEGIHLGAMAGTVDLLQRGFTGLETRDGKLWLDPCLPDALQSLSFRLHYREHHGVEVTVRHDRLRVRRVNRVGSTTACDDGHDALSVNDAPMGSSSAVRTYDGVWPTAARPSPARKRLRCPATPGQTQFSQTPPCLAPPARAPLRRSDGIPRNLSPIPPATWESSYDRSHDVAYTGARRAPAGERVPSRCRKRRPNVCCRPLLGPAARP